MSKTTNAKGDESLTAIPFVMTYHPKLNLFKPSSYMGKEVKRVFTPKML